MKDKIGVGLFIEVATLIFIIFIARGQGVSKAEFWENFNIGTEKLDIHYHVIGYAGFNVNGTDVSTWLKDSTVDTSIKYDINSMLDSLALKKIGGEIFYKGAQDTLIADSEIKHLDELKELFTPTIIFNDSIRTYYRNFPITVHRYYPADKFKITPLLKSRDKPYYFDLDWIDDLTEENIVNIDELSGFTNIDRLETLIKLAEPVLEENEHTLELTWRKGSESHSYGKNYLGGGISLYKINNQKGKEIYYADYLFDGLEWTRDEYGEEVVDERFNIWYHNWVFWAFAIAISISIIRRFLIWNSL
ncbi:MAG: hypothetical protein R8G66_25175 [Cytophagales bacterium]|nr:hypothetical protein [Cytophagales bacterium]